MGNLTARFVAQVKKAGRYGDGACLQLNVRDTGAKSWELNTTIQGRRRVLGLGSVDALSLADARILAAQMRRTARNGGDPDLDRKRMATKANTTFEAVTLDYHTTLAATFTSEKYRKLWLSGLRKHVFPLIGSRPIHSIATADLISVLRPIWSTQYPTARKLRQRLERIFDYAKGAGLYVGENPAAGIKTSLPKSAHKEKNHEAMPWAEVSDLMQRLQGIETMASATLQIIIHTAARSKEARTMRWADVDLDAGLWDLPEALAKEDARRIVLTPEAVTILRRLKGQHPTLVFPSDKGKTQSVNVFNKLRVAANMGDNTVHGFRTSMRVWASEYARAPFEVAEALIGHKIGNTVSRAYDRTDYLDLRRPLNGAWSKHVSGQKVDTAALNKIYAEWTSAQELKR